MIRSLKIPTAERVTHGEPSDNYVFQRSLVAYQVASTLIEGNVLEIGCGEGYGIPIMLPAVVKYVAVDKFPLPIRKEFFSSHFSFLQMKVPLMEHFPNDSFDCIISFQLIEHIKKDELLVSEAHRLLKSGGTFIVSTPNKEMSLSRNPWHVREYGASELHKLLGKKFAVKRQGIHGNEKVMKYYLKNKAALDRILRYDVFKLQHHAPRHLLQMPYDIANRINRRTLLKSNTDLVKSITAVDFSVTTETSRALDLFYIATKTE